MTNWLVAAEPDVHPPITAVELPDGIQLAYADERDRRCAVDLENADAIDFGRSRPFRKPPAYRGQRNFPGWWWSATTRSHVAYESWLERHHLMEADRDARVTGIAGQPFELSWPRGKGKRPAGHVPDFLFRTLDGRAIVTDCRPVKRSDEDFRYKAAVTAAACRVIGWEFRLAGEPDPVWAANLRWLAGYRQCTALECTPNDLFDVDTAPVERPAVPARPQPVPVKAVSARGRSLPPL